MGVFAGLRDWCGPNIGTQDIATTFVISNLGDEHPNPSSQNPFHYWELRSSQDTTSSASDPAPLAGLSVLKWISENRIVITIAFLLPCLQI